VHLTSDFCKDGVRGTTYKETERITGRAAAFLRWYRTAELRTLRVPIEESPLVATVRQIAANRRNATLSTGPTTDAGKAASRRNALKHGNAGDGTVLPDDETEKVKQRVAEWAAVVRPVSTLEAFYVAQMATESVRVERCQRDERVLLLRRAAWAESGWDEDRRHAAEELGARLPRDPARTVGRLRQTSQGCDWLLERWHMLAQSLQEENPWDGARRALALDLLGIPAALRDGGTPLDIDTDTGAVAHQSALAAERIAELEQLKADVMDDRDEVEREAAVEGVGTGDAATERSLALNRRYESACQHRLDRALRLLLSGRLTERTATPSEPVPAAAPSDGPRPVEIRPTPPAPAARAEPAPAVAVVPMAAAVDRPRGNRRWRRAQERRARGHARQASSPPMAASVLR
jgi:hypothetical protein